MSNDRQRIVDSFGFTPSDEFFAFWDFAESIKPSDPTQAFHDLLSMTLVGPFSFLAGHFESRTAYYDPCLHWRYFGDPPELVTIITGGTDGLHWGYVVDEPNQNPVGIAGYFAHDDVSVFQESASLFQFLAHQIQATLADIEGDMKKNAKLAKDPSAKRLLTEGQKMQKALDEFCSTQAVSFPVTAEIAFVDHCNPPPPFPFPEPDEFDSLPALVESGIKQLVKEGYSQSDARLKIGRMLWHWHYDGNPKLEAVAFKLLDDEYQSLGRKFLRHVLHQHREHRHRRSLDVFDKR